MTTHVDDKAVELIVEGFSWILDVLVYMLDNARGWPPRMRPVSRLSMQAFGSPFPCSRHAAAGRGSLTVFALLHMHVLVGCNIQYPDWLEAPGMRSQQNAPGRISQPQGSSAQAERFSCPMAEGLRSMEILLPPRRPSFS